MRRPVHGMPPFARAIGTCMLVAILGTHSTARDTSETLAWTNSCPPSRWHRAYACRRSAERRNARTACPDGNHGIAARYPGRRRNRRGSRGRVRRGLRGRFASRLWRSAGRMSAIATTCRSPSDVPPGSGGKHSLSMHRPGGSTELGRAALPPHQEPGGGWGYDQLFARFYVKFAPDCGEIHHFGTTMGGNWPATPWPMVKAGKPPDGAKSFWTGIEPFGKSWTWDLLHLLVRHARQPAARPDLGQQLHPRPEAHDRTGQMDLRRADDEGQRPGRAQTANRHSGSTASLISHLGKGFPQGRWIWDKFEPGKGGAGMRWNAAEGRS